MRRLRALWVALGELLSEGLGDCDMGNRNLKEKTRVIDVPKMKAFQAPIFEIDVG